MNKYEVLGVVGEGDDETCSTSCRTSTWVSMFSSRVLL